MKKNIRAIFENKVGEYLIPNGMSEHLTNELIEFVRKHDTDDGTILQKFRETHPNVYLPYDSNCDNELSLEVDILSELEIDDAYITTYDLSMYYPRTYIRNT